MNAAGRPGTAHHEPIMQLDYLHKLFITSDCRTGECHPLRIKVLPLQSSVNQDRTGPQLVAGMPPLQRQLVPLAGASCWASCENPPAHAEVLRRCPQCQVSSWRRRLPAWNWELVWHRRMELLVRQLCREVAENRSKYPCYLRGKKEEVFIQIMN